MGWDWDYIIVGSGFGGSVAALRLGEKGYKVLVLEAGRRFNRGDYARSSWDLPRYLWAPTLGCYGIQRLDLLGHVLVLSGTGVGGGSLVYANTLLVPPEPFFTDPQWAGLDADWQSTLAPHYETASHMLGVTECPYKGPADEILKDYARELGREEHFSPTQVGVFFGEPGVEVPDPYFDGAGPPRVGCTFSGSCMIGCNNGGKNTLDRNYLYLAEGQGAVIEPDRTVTRIKALRGGGYQVVARRTSGHRSPEHRFTARGVFMAAGALNTNRLLLEASERGDLDLPGGIGKVVRTNSEILNGAVSRSCEHDFSQGVAITSSLFVDEHTHVEPVRYPKGSDAMMALLGTVMVDNGERRWLKWMGTVARRPMAFLKTLWPLGWAEHAVILLVMQDLDNHLELRLGRSWRNAFRRGLVSFRPDKLPTQIPAGDAAARFVARAIGGEPISAITEVLLDTPVTAHILGGCPMGESEETGVVDKHSRVFGHEELYVVDGAQMPANLGVNPSLTITALAEHALSQVPTKEEKGW